MAYLGHPRRLPPFFKDDSGQSTGVGRIRVDRHAGGRVRGREESALDRVLELDAEDTPWAGDASNTYKGTIALFEVPVGDSAPDSRACSMFGLDCRQSDSWAFRTKTTGGQSELDQGDLRAPCDPDYSM